MARRTDGHGRPRYWQKGGGFDRNVRDEHERRRPQSNQGVVYSQRPRGAGVGRAAGGLAVVERALADGASGRGAPVRPAAGRPRHVGGMGGVQVSVRRIREGSTDLSKQRSVARVRCHPALEVIQVAIPVDKFPLFVLLPDEGMFRVVEDRVSLAWHEAFDLEGEPHWVWLSSGERFRLRQDAHEEYLLEKASSDERDLCAMIGRWCLRWRQEHPTGNKHLGDYAILKRWLAGLARSEKGDS